MVTTRAGSRAASEAPSVGGTPAKPSTTTTTSGDTPITRATKLLDGVEASPSKRRKSKTSSSSTPTKPSSSSRNGRRSKQKDRVRALRAAEGLTPPPLDADPETTASLRSALRSLLEAEESICISRVPRSLRSDWEELIPATRAVVWDEAESGVVEVLVNGQLVPRGERQSGAMRVRRGDNF